MGFQKELEDTNQQVASWIENNKLQNSFSEVNQSYPVKKIDDGHDSDDTMLQSESEFIPISEVFERIRPNNNNTNQIKINENSRKTGQKTGPLKSYTYENQLYQSTSANDLETKGNNEPIIEEPPSENGQASNISSKYKEYERKIIKPMSTAKQIELYGQARPKTANKKEFVRPEKLQRKSTPSKIVNYPLTSSNNNSNLNLMNNVDKIGK